MGEKLLTAVALSFIGAVLPSAGTAQDRGVTSEFVLVAPLVEEMPRIDGRLDELVWARAAVARDFVQREPNGGELAEQPTEVRIAYTTRALLIGARLFDGDASRIVDTEYARDADLQANDSFEVFLDTFHDHRNALYFATNPVGVQRDALVRNEGAAINWEWDGVWHVASTRDGGGWTVEIAIPFSTLRFRPDSADGWGINFGRLVARTREESYWAPISRDWGFNGKWRVSAFRSLQGITGAEPGRFQLKPFLLGGFGQDFVDSSGEVGLAREAGLDAKISVTSTLVADLTLNTDFAQVEADQQQVNLTRFPLSFPEKREFFLENAGLFQVGERVRPFEPPSTLLFFSRRIGLTKDGDPVPLIGGARLTGKLGRYDLGFLDIVAKETQIEGKRVPRTNFAALRLQRDILARSSVGGMLLSKVESRGSSNQVAVADTTITFANNGTITGFAAKSFAPSRRRAAHAVGVDGAWETDRGNLIGTYVDIGEDFHSAMGFVPRTGIRKYRGAAFLGRRPQLPGIRQMFFGNDHLYITDRQGRLQSQTNGLGSFFLFHDGSVLFGGWVNAAEGLTKAFEIREDVLIPTGNYRFNQAVMFYNSDQSRRLSGRVSFTGGGFYHGTLRSLNLAGRVRPHGRLMLELETVRNRVALPVEGGRFSKNLVIGRGTFAFSARAFLRALVQLNEEDREVRSNILFRYTYRPGADLFVVYNEDRGTHGETPAVKRRQLLIKLTIYVGG